MKKLFTIILFVCLVFIITLFGCNRQVFDLKYKFDHVHIYETGKCYEIKSWRDYDDSDQIQVVLEDGTVLLLHSTDCALVQGDCVLCKDRGK